MNAVAKPSLIEFGALSFLIMDAPRASNLHLYLKECKKYNVTHIVRISEPSYSVEEVEKAGIQLHEMFFDDGASPPADIITRWRTLIHSTFDNHDIKADPNKPCIAIHCVAGLGRAPVMVAIALIEYGMDAVQAVTLIRSKRRGAINAVQLNYLVNYKPAKPSSGGSCLLM